MRIDASGKSFTFEAEPAAPAEQLEPAGEVLEGEIVED